MFYTGQSESNSTYNSVINNTSPNNYCIGCIDIPTLKVYKCNIFNNSDNDHVIYFDKCNQLTVEECNIVDNYGDILFRIENSIMEIINCYLKNEGNIQGNIDVANTYISEIKNELSHLSTALCHADYPLPINLRESQKK